MTQKTEERRGRLRQSLIEIAERKIARNGISALTARELAAEAGCAVGAIYTVFPDMDALVAAVNSRTLSRLEGAVAAILAGDAKSGSPKRALTLLGKSYFEFVFANPQLWSAIFELGFRSGRELADWQVAENLRLIGLVVRPLRQLLPGESDERLVLLAKALFSAVHGIVSLGQQRRFMAVPPEEIEAQITFIVEAFCDGVMAGNSSR